MRTSILNTVIIKNTILLLFSCLFVLTSCDQEDEINSDLINTNMTKSKALGGVSDCIIVAPSGDITGVTDANNIEDALNDAKASGGTVCLTDGDHKTTDNYYTSRNIVVEGFNGTLRGESMDNTLIYAGRKSESIGFEPAYSPWWSEFRDFDLPTIFQLDNATGDVTITHLAILVKDDEPTDPIPGLFGLSTHISTFIEVIGGENNTNIKNVRLEGRPSLADGNRNHMNVESGIHVMLAPYNIWPGEKGNLTVKNVEVENIGGDAISFMRFIDGSKINVDGVIAKNVQGGIAAGGLYNSSVNISNMDISLNSYGWGSGILLYLISSGVQIMHNTIRGGSGIGLGINLWEVNNAIVFENKFVNLETQYAAIEVIWGSNGNSIYRNDYTDSNLPGWTSTSDGPGAIYLQSGTSDNFIHEMKFPTGRDLLLCEMILDEGNNEIHNWQPCENSPKLNFSMLESKFNSNSRFHILKTD